MCVNSPPDAAPVDTSIRTSAAPGSSGTGGSKSATPLRGRTRGGNKTTTPGESTIAVVTPHGICEDGDGGDSLSHTLTAAEHGLLLCVSVPDAAMSACWPQVVGFSLAEKAWGMVDVAGLSPIGFEDDAFDQLVLPATLRPFMGRPGITLAELTAPYMLGQPPFSTSELQSLIEPEYEVDRFALDVPFTRLSCV